MRAFWRLRIAWLFIWHQLLTLFKHSQVNIFYRKNKIYRIELKKRFFKIYSRSQDHTPNFTDPLPNFTKSVKFLRLFLPAPLDECELIKKCWEPNDVILGIQLQFLEGSFNLIISSYIIVMDEELNIVSRKNVNLRI